MTYQELVEKVRIAVQYADASAITGHMAVQINIFGEGEGAFYVEFTDGEINVQPFEYYDRNVLITTTAQIMLDVLEGRKEIIDAYNDKDMFLDGDMGSALVLQNLKWKEGNLEKAKAAYAKMVAAREQDRKAADTKEEPAAAAAAKEVKTEAKDGKTAGPKDDEVKTEEPVSRNFIEQIIDKDLAEGAYKQICTRFPPEPNGYLHIGHAKSILLNYGLAQEYKGEFHMRFDDTNPTKEKIEFVESIKKDIQWLGADWGKHLYYASNYFEQMYEGAVKLIKKGKAFVCDLTAEQIRQYRGTLTEPGKDSPYRNRSVEENLRLFEEMKEGKCPDGSRVLRARIDMASPNINMRDPVIYRVAHLTHHNTGDRWCIYPMYDFAHPIEDAIEGVTHSICTLEFEDHRPLYDWVVRELEYPHPPKQIEFAKLYLTNVVTGKRYIKKLVEDGVVDGWDDPRLVSIAALRRRGYTPESIQKFVELCGVTKAQGSVDYAMLEYCIREDLKMKRPRVMAVLDPIRLVIDNYPEGQTEELEVANNLENESLGSRKVPFSRELYIEREDFMEVRPKKYFRLYPGNEVRLMNAYFVKCVGCDKDKDGNVTAVHCTYDPASKGGMSPDGRKVKGTIHWVNAETAVQAECRLYENLIDEEKGVYNEEDGSMNINPNSQTILKNCWVEPSLKGTEAYESFQFVRNGFFCADARDSRPDALVFNRIVSLKSSFKLPAGAK